VVRNRDLSKLLPVDETKITEESLHAWYQDDNPSTL